MLRSLKQSPLLSFESRIPAFTLITSCPYCTCKPQPTHIPPIPPPQHDLRQKIPRRMPNMIIRERSHGEITMIVPILPSHIHFPFALRRSDEVLRQQLALFVESVARALSTPFGLDHSCASGGRRGREGGREGGVGV